MSEELEAMKIQQMRYKKHFPLFLRSIAMGISIIFHPLLILLYAYVVLAWCNPFLFASTSFTKVFQHDVNNMLFIWLAIFSFAVPMLAILMMRALGFISSLSMPQRMERIGPYIVVGFLYIIIFVNFNNNPSIPAELRLFSLGATIGLFMAFLINLFTKISMHTVGMGGLAMMVLFAISRSYMSNEYVFILTLIACGLVGTSRLMLSAHEPADVYGGYFIGAASVIVAGQFV
jgi:membrane-associated phospholipid phosphatase